MRLCQGLNKKIFSTPKEKNLLEELEEVLKHLDAIHVSKMLELICLPVRTDIKTKLRLIDSESPRQMRHFSEYMVHWVTWRMFCERLGMIKLKRLFADHDNIKLSDGRDKYEVNGVNVHSHCVKSIFEVMKNKLTTKPALESYA